MTPDPDESVFADAAAEINERRDKSRLPNWWFTARDLGVLIASTPVLLFLICLNWLDQRLP